MKGTRSTYTKKGDEKLTPDETRALVRSLMVDVSKPATVGARFALILSILSFVVASIALAVALR